MTTKTTKIADRYAALAAIAQTLDGVAFTPAKKPTTKDCEELSTMIEAHRSALAVVENDDDVTSDAVDKPASTMSEDVVDDVLLTSADERAAAIEAKRADARRRFETATKATAAHGYALISAATCDGSRMDNMRAKLAEFPEAVRAGACRLAAEKLVQPGSKIQGDLRALYNEQPIAAKVATAKRTSVSGSKELKVWRSKSGSSATISISLPESFKGCEHVVVSYEDGRIVVTKKS